MTTPSRAKAMLAARAKGSHDKRNRALAAVQALEAAGTPVTATAAKFRQVDWYVVGRLRGLMIKKRGRNLHAGQADARTEEWFNGHGLYRLRGTIRYPKAA